MRGVKKMKKIISIMMAGVLSFSLVACGGAKTEAVKEEATAKPQEQTEAKPEAGSDSYQIGFVISTLQNPFFVSLKEGAEEKAALLGIEIIVLDSQDDPSKEMSNVEDLITRGVDIILVNPTDSDAVVNSVEAANIAGVPVITVDRVSNGGDVIAHVASDNIAGGKMAGEYIIEKLGGKGNVVELEGIAGTSAARERGEGFNTSIGGTELGVVAKQTADFNRAKGLEVMENILQAQPDIQAVFAHNDEMALGALEAVKASGRDIIIVGFDATDDAIESVASGELAATVAQQPKLIGELGIETALEVLKGETVDASIPVALQLVTQ